jgi:hypothetical protein
LFMSRVLLCTRATTANRWCSGGHFIGVRGC